ncbi:bactofilin family protein [Halobacterium zhouii]|uniref:bactofilin family protein n=1 Tax=Halobacterium zhouii TaxID=2902624 RepID=UPI001E518B3D|nr:polymer-forming cytoskeletal protein [Halobacterium zhouii]
MATSVGRHALAVTLVVLLATSLFAGVAAADQRTGDTIIVEEGETVTGGLQATGGTVIVRGTVEGDLEAFAGTIEIAESGVVTGDVTAVGGSVRIAGRVEGDAQLASGTVVITESAVVTGDVQAATGSFTLDGTVQGSVRVGAGTIVLGPQAVVQGDLVYDGDLTRAEGSAVGGQVREDSSLGGGFGVPSIASWVVSLYSLLVTLLVGALLLLVLPGTSATVARETANSPVRTAVLGILVLVGVPLLVVVLLLTVVGIPIAFVVAFLYALLLWLAFVWGQYAIGAWLLGLADTDSRWLALIVGVLVVFLLGLVPILGGIVSFVVLLFGLGGVGVAVYRAGRRRREDDTLRRENGV